MRIKLLNWKNKFSTTRSERGIIGEQAILFCQESSFMDSFRVLVISNDNLWFIWFFEKIIYLQDAASQTHMHIHFLEVLITVYQFIRIRAVISFFSSCPVWSDFFSRYPYPFFGGFDNCGLLRLFRYISTSNSYMHDPIF